jgi:hypothetical protein
MREGRRGAENRNEDCVGFDFAILVSAVLCAGFRAVAASLERQVRTIVFTARDLAAINEARRRNRDVVRRWSGVEIPVF